jgi:hypothetical protein
MGERRSRPASQRQTKVMDDRLEPLSATAIASQNVLVELLAEDTPPTKNCVAPEATSRNPQFDAPTAEGKV